MFREIALIYSQTGRPRRAHYFFRRSLACAKKQSASYEQGQTLVAWGEVKLANGTSDAIETQQRGQQILSGILIGDETTDDLSDGGRETLSLADRFETVLRDGRKILSAYSEQEIYDRACDAATRLLRGEKCTIIRVDRTNGQMSYEFLTGAKTEFQSCDCRRSSTFR